MVSLSPAYTADYVLCTFSDTMGATHIFQTALLIHGLTCSSNTWERVAQALVEAGILLPDLSLSAIPNDRPLGYFVVAPNLLSHGFRRGTDFSVGNLAKDIQPYFLNTHYDIVIGHS